MRKRRRFQMGSQEIKCAVHIDNFVCHRHSLFNNLIATITITCNGSFTLPATETDTYIMCIEPNGNLHESRVSDHCNHFRALSLDPIPSV